MEFIRLIDAYAAFITGCAAVALAIISGFKFPRLMSVIPSTLKRNDSLPYVGYSGGVLVCLAGAISAASWFHAAMPATLHSSAWKNFLIKLPAAYPVFSTAGFTMLVMLAIMASLNTTQGMTQGALPERAIPFPSKRI